MDQRVDRSRRTSPRDVPLVVHRRQSGAGREDHAQGRVRGARRRRRARPTRRPGAARRTRRRPATTRAATPLRGRPRPARGARSRACRRARRRRAPGRAAPTRTASARRSPGPARPTSPPSSSASSPARSGSSRRTEAQARNPDGSAAAPSCQASSSADADGPRSDSMPERRREGQTGQADAVARVLVQSQRHVVVSRLDLVRRLTVGEQRPPTQVRRAGARA